VARRRCVPCFCIAAARAQGGCSQHNTTTPTYRHFGTFHDSRIPDAACGGPKFTMWLDRRPGPPGSGSASGSGTPQSSSRPISPLPLPLPLPRRTSSSRGPYLTSTSQRPGATPRSSSLSLVSNGSSSSLLASSKRANGSALKHSTTVESAPDPEEVLARILGPSPVGTGVELETTRTHRITEEELGLDFDFGGLRLGDLANSDVEPEGRAPYRPQNIEACMFPLS